MGIAIDIKQTAASDYIFSIWRARVSG